MSLCDKAPLNRFLRSRLANVLDFTDLDIEPRPEGAVLCRVFTQTFTGRAVRDARESDRPGRQAEGKSASSHRLGRAGQLSLDYKIFTARAARIAIVASEIEAWIIISAFAHRESTGTSVGENAVLVLNAKNK